MAWRTTSHAMPAPHCICVTRSVAAHPVPDAASSPPPPPLPLPLLPEPPLVVPLLLVAPPPLLPADPKPGPSFSEEPLFALEQATTSAHAAERVADSAIVRTRKIAGRVRMAAP
jgi:hypothetical protein